MQQQDEFQALRLLGGRLCLDFVNTVEDRTGDNPEEFLTSYSALARWGLYAGALTDAEATRLIELADGDETGASSALDRALVLREALYRTFHTIATGRESDRDDLEQVEAAYERAIASAHLEPAGGRFQWGWETSIQQFDRMLWPVALSAIDLLTEGELRRVKVCANPYGCGWLFYDGSKNASRRWCSMEGCGSRVKMRRQYAKRRGKVS